MFSMADFFLFGNELRNIIQLQWRRTLVQHNFIEL